MNLLSHYFFAEFELNESLYCLGLIYPDLNRKWKKNLVKLPQCLNIGALEHCLIDKNFHKLPDFKNNISILSKSSSLNSTFKRELFHVGIEIGIDYYLFQEIKDNIFFERIYDLLNSLDIDLFFKNNNIGEKFIQNFINKRVLESYGTKIGGKTALMKTYQRISDYLGYEKNLSFSDICDVYEKSLIVSKKLLPQTCTLFNKKFD